MATATFRIWRGNADGGDRPGNTPPDGSKPGGE